MTATHTILAPGVGATHYVGSDRYAYTVIEVKSPTVVVVQQDHSTRADKRGPYTESQEYTFTPNPDAPKIVISKRKNGVWYIKGQRMGRCGFSIGKRRMYQDPCF